MPSVKDNNEWGQFGSLITDEQYKDITQLFSGITKDTEFEVMFFNYNDTVMNYEKYRTVLSFLTQRSKVHKLKLETTTVLDITYNIDGENNYRITIEGIDNVNKYMKMLHKRKNHVIFRVLSSMISEGNKDMTIIKKIKEKENLVDVSQFDLRVRRAEEISVDKKDMKMLIDLPETERDNISFRFKERVSLFVQKDDNHTLRIDLTKTKTTKNINKLENTNPRYELEIELMAEKKNDKYLDEIIKEINILLKIIQQTNYIISKIESTEILNEYARILNLDMTRAKTLDERRAVSLEVQHVTEILPNKYAPTDKADGERYFLIIIKQEIYLISHNLAVKKTGLKINKKEYNDSILDGEYIFIPSLNRYLFMAFDCLHKGQEDIRKIVSLMDRLKHADEIIKECFILKGQTGFQLKDYNGDFEMKKILKFHSDQIDEHIKTMNKDMEYEKQYPLIRRKYFIPVVGGKDYEVFRYAELMWNRYMYNPNIKCPYHLDGLIFHPLQQAYITSKKDSKYEEYKWKPTTQNSVDFYVEFKKDDFGKIITVYDNSFDDNLENDNMRVANKPYRICYLHVGSASKEGEYPTLFQEDSGNHIANLFLEEGEARDMTGNIIQDKTVVEFYYDNNLEKNSRFRWVPMRTRYDKTESVQRYNSGYGNYIDVANKVWRSITNPILMDDFHKLGDENSYYKHIDFLRKKIGHDIIVSAAKDDKYFQVITNLGKNMRQFHNWAKDLVARVYYGPFFNVNEKKKILDIAFGRGADIMKYYFAKTNDIVVGVEIDYEALNSAIDGANSRYNKAKKSYPNFPKMFFVQADCSALLDYSEQEKVLLNMHPDNKKTMERFFSLDASKRTQFEVITCQFALHYFLKNGQTWNNFKENINMYLKNGGYMTFTTSDARQILKMLGKNNNHIVYYTTDKGEKKVLFEYVKKFDNLDIDKPIPPGYAVDFHAAWLFREGEYETEYLVDDKFIINDLLTTCGLELVDTSLLIDQYHIYNDFMTKYYVNESKQDTLGYLTKINKYYDKNDEINRAYLEHTSTFRMYVLRKKDDFKPTKTVIKQEKTINKQMRQTVRSKKVKQQGGADESSEENLLDILMDKNLYYIPEIKDNTNSYFSSIHNILQNDEYVPKQVSSDELFKDLNIKLKSDEKLDDTDIEIINKNIKINVELGKKTLDSINGLQLIKVDVDCNNNYDINTIGKKKQSKKDKYVILIQDGTHYRPIYKIDGDKFKGVLTNDEIKKFIN
jgi:hypothetical protein